MTPVITFDNVSKRFVLPRERPPTWRDRLKRSGQNSSDEHYFWALRDVSFAVEPGQSLALVGHNGAGKSTALKLMTQILEPTRGNVQIGGRIAALLELGSGFHPDLSGRENIFLYGSLMGFGRAAMLARLDEIVAFAEMEQFIDVPVRHYSSGMYTRLAFSVATAVDPEILITDEVLAVGDEAFQRRCMDRIFAFRRAGKTVVFVSHALETVRTLCDVAVWLDRGVARLVGGAGEVVDAYLDEVNRSEQARLAQAAGRVDDIDTRRRGTRELEIVRVELLDAHGVERPAFRTGERLTVRMHYRVQHPIVDPIFGIALHHESGLLLSGPNTRFDGFALAVASGAGHIDYQIAALPLQTGNYALSVAAYDSAMLHPYDYHDRSYQVLVQGGDLRQQHGILAIVGAWKVGEMAGHE